MCVCLQVLPQESPLVSLERLGRLVPEGMRVTPDSKASEVHKHTLNKIRMSHSLGQFFAGVTCVKWSSPLLSFLYTHHFPRPTLLFISPLSSFPLSAVCRCPVSSVLQVILATVPAKEEAPWGCLAYPDPQEETAAPASLDERVIPVMAAHPA